jgi:hypothetical protein
MEAIGKVNRYVRHCLQKPGGKLSLEEELSMPKDSYLYTVNLANGVTPFSLFLNGVSYYSTMYRLGADSAITVQRAFYRPTKEEFLKWNPAVQDHVLNGGLLHASISEARQLHGDEVQPGWDFRQLQAYNHKVYGRGLPCL